MYKDKEKQREANRIASQKRRQGMTEGMTGEGMTRIEFIQKELNDPFLIKGIESAAKLFDNRDTRYERVYKYKLWHDEYRVTHPMGTLNH